ncbi:MAG TPA: ATP-binding protein [Streptosporangiaceae bacterium]|nr:ATP-binding protein [Streptosporangiaceae bacterium]
MSMITRVAAIIRSVALAYIVVQVIIWHSFYTAAPWRLAGPAAAVAWAAVAVVYLGRHRPVWPLIGIDTGCYLVLALGAGWCVPVAMRGEAGNWLFIAMTSQLVVPIWFAPRPLSVPLALASGLGYWAGTAASTAGIVASAAGGYPGMAPAASVLLMFAIVTLHWSGRRLLSGRASRADTALAAADRDASDQYVVLSMNIERREHERLLHDTVLNTLTAIARAGGGEAVVGRCRHDITLLEQALSDPGNPARARPRHYGGLLADIRAIAHEMRARGLDVHVDVEGGSPAGSGLPAHTCGPAASPVVVAAVPAAAVPAVPVRVGGAIANAVHEALANVAAHARTTTAWVTVSLEAAGGGAAAVPGALRVTVRDAGVGFDPARVDPARLGLRRSITERVADWGGSASVQSAPGEGTVVSLCWPASGPAAEEGASSMGASSPGASSPGATIREAAPW